MSAATGTPMVGPYRLDGLVGRGGMGEVFRAFDTRRQRTVALKLLPSALSNDPEYRERFRRESLAAAALVSPHVVPIHDFGEVEGRLFIDMRLIEGVDLSRHVDGKPMAVGRAADIVVQVCDALGDAHDHGVVHRDVKPSNILLTESGFAYLVDFGIATTGAADTALTATGSTIGTFGYMAPERFDGSAADPRADVYSLGCVLHELLAGVRPFAEHQSTPSLIRAHLMLEPSPLSSLGAEVPAELDRVVSTAMAKDPVRRYATTRDLAQALQDATGQERADAPPSTAVTSFAGSRAEAPQRLIGTAARPSTDAGPSEGAAPSRGPARRRTALVCGVAALLVAGGVVAGTQLTGADSAQAASGSTTAVTAERLVSDPSATAPLITPPLASSRGSAPVQWTLEASSSREEALITYNNGQGGIEQEPSAAVPWTKEIAVEPDRNTNMNFSVSSKLVVGDNQPVTVTCRLLRDGRVVDEQTSRGSYAAAQCNSL